MMVMAAGKAHLGGNLAWLSISGEDATDLIATAPISARRIVWAKIEAVMGVNAFCSAGRRARVRISYAGGRSGCGHIDRHRIGNIDSALFSYTGAAQPVSYRHFSIANRDLCGSSFVDRLGPQLGVGGGRILGRVDPGAHCHWHPRRCLAEQPTGSSVIRLAIALARQSRKFSGSVRDNFVSSLSAIHLAQSEQTVRRRRRFRYPSSA